MQSSPSRERQSQSDTWARPGLRAFRKQLLPQTGLPAQERDGAASHCRRGLHLNPGHVSRGTRSGVAWAWEDAMDTSVSCPRAVYFKQMHLACDQNKFNKDKIRTRPWFPVLFQLKGLLRDKVIPNLAGKCKISVEHLVRLQRKD